MTAAIIVLFFAWLLWTYFVYQCGYHNASRDAEEIAGRQLWARQEGASGAKKMRANYGRDIPTPLLGRNDDYLC